MYMSKALRTICTRSIRTGRSLTQWTVILSSSPEKKLRVWCSTNDGSRFSITFHKAWIKRRLSLTRYRISLRKSYQSIVVILPRPTSLSRDVAPNSTKCRERVVTRMSVVVKDARSRSVWRSECWKLVRRKNATALMALSRALCQSDSMSEAEALACLAPSLALVSGGRTRIEHVQGGYMLF